MGTVLQYLTQGKIGWISTGSLVTLVLFFLWQRNRWLSLRCFWLGKNKSRREIFTIFTYLKPSLLYPQAESNSSAHPDRNKPLLLRRHTLFYILHSWLEAFHQETHRQLIGLPKIVWNRKISCFTVPSLSGIPIHVGCQHISNGFIEMMVWGALGWFCEIYIGTHTHTYVYVFLSARLSYPEGVGNEGCSGSCHTWSLLG